jgi:hypothetical protein
MMDVSTSGPLGSHHTANRLCQVAQDKNNPQTLPTNITDLLRRLAVLPA